MRLIEIWFTQHPKSVGETYLGHLRFALWFSGRIGQAAAAALIHALVPCLFEKTAGRLVRELADCLDRRS